MTNCLRAILVVAAVNLMSDGIVAAFVAAQSTLTLFAAPIRSTVTDTATKAKAPGSPAASTVPVNIGLSTMAAPTQANLDPRRDWPSPVNDQENRLFALIDTLEYRPRTGGGQGHDDYRWDIEGWYGGDYNRVWFKSEGQQDTAFKANYDVDFQLLYGRFIQRYYDFQVGGRVETQSFRGHNVTRGLAAIGIEGLVPYSYQIEPTLFIDQNGAVSARLAATKDLLLTQRLITQLRFETNAAIQRLREFSTGSGTNVSAARHNDEGILADEHGQWNSAKQHFEAAIKVAADLAEAHYNLGMTFYRLGNLREGDTHFIKAANLAPGNKVIWNSPPLGSVSVPEKESKMPGHGGDGHSH